MVQGIDHIRDPRLNKVLYSFIPVSPELVDIICPSMVQGIHHIRDPRLNKVLHSFIPVSPELVYANRN